MGGKDCSYYFVHIVESANAILLGNVTRDFETKEDGQTLELYAAQLNEQGYQSTIQIGFGNPKKEIPKYVKEFNAELLILGSHGHGFIKDMIFGTSIDTIRHKVDIPVLIVK